jgi:prevent-host-death family protein
MSLTHNANIVGAYDAKTRFSELLDQVQSGEEITITKHGTPVARLVPVKKKTTPQERREAIERWKESSKGITLGGLKIRDLINEGRP